MNDGDQVNENDFLSDLSFSPQWAKETAASHFEHLSKRAERFSGDGDDRGRDRGDRRGFRRDGPPRGDRPPFRRDRPPFRGDRPPREDGPARFRPDAERGDRPFRGDRPYREGCPPFRGDRPFRRDGPPREPAPFGIRFLPEHKALGLIARKVQQSRRAMPLRDLVALFFKNPGSTLVRVEFDEEHKDSRFHQCTACGWFARTPEELLSHQLSAHFLDRFEEKEIEVEPPKGKYATVARCGVTGRLLAPPNDHSYNRRVLEALRDPACAGLSESEYRARIELVSDPALVEEWRAAQTKKTVYVRKTAAKPGARNPKPAVEAPAAERPPAEGGETAAEPAAEAAAPEPPPAETPVAPAAPAFDREEAEAIFRAEAAPAMTRVSRAVTAPHAAVDGLSDRYLQGEIRRAWEREARSHVSSLFFAVRGGLKACRLALFRASDPARTDFAAPRAPTPLDAATAVPALRAVLDWVAEHRGGTRGELLAALAPDGTDAEAKAELLKQFAFAVDRGHLIAYANGTLALPEAHPFYRATTAEAPAEEAPAEKEPRAENAEEPAAEEPHAENVEEPAAEEPRAAPAEEAPAEKETHAESAEGPAAEEPREASAESAEPAPEPEADDSQV